MSHVKILSHEDGLVEVQVNNQKVVSDYNLDADQLARVLHAAEIAYTLVEIDPEPEPWVPDISEYCQEDDEDF